MNRRIVCAALYYAAAGGITVIGPRHFDSTMHRQIRLMNLVNTHCEEGFIDQHGSFLNRVDARKIAVAADQIIRRVGGDELKLYSENLY